MNLPDYISKHGEDVCATAWGYSLRRVRSWRYRERRPRIQEAQRIVRLTNSEITIDEIYQVGTNDLQGSMTAVSCGATVVESN